MAIDGISRVAVFGTGQMGPGIAVVAALAGCTTVVVGRSSASVARADASVSMAIDFLLAHQVVTDVEAAGARSRLLCTSDVTQARPTDLAIECIVEDLALKQQFVRDMEQVVSPDTIISSDTSGLRITDISALMERPERAVTTHFWNPPHLMPLVDVIKGDRTEQQVVDRTVAFLRRCGKEPVVGRRDVLGQVGNRLFQAVIREAVYMVQEGIVSAEDADAAIRNGFGLRFPVYGALEHMDAVGLDLALAVQSAVNPALCATPDAGPLLKNMVASGALGVKSGAGFYDWSKRDIAAVRRQRDEFLVERLKATRGAAGR